MTPEIVLGPPGTGKTSSMLAIVEEELANGTQPGSIGFFTFTKRAAEEAIARACTRFGYDKKQFPYFSTLHSLCYRQLKLKKENVFSTPNLKEFAAHFKLEITGRLSEDGTSYGLSPGDRAMFLENLGRMRMTSLREEFKREPELTWPYVEHVANCYMKYKAEAGVSDYTDMLARFIAADVHIPLELLIIDECQDLSLLQWHVVIHLARHAKRVVIAGDDDQAIFRWAGADVEYFINMQGNVRVLNQSWRVPTNIQHLANKIVKPISHRREKEWMSRDAIGLINQIYGIHQADYTAQWTEDKVQPVLVLTRNTYLLTKLVVPFLRAKGILYEYNGRSSINPNKYNCILNWEKLRRGETISVFTAREIYEQLRSKEQIKHGFKELKQFADEKQLVSIDDLKKSGGLLTEAPWYEALQLIDRTQRDYIRKVISSGEKPRQRPRVRISTIHSAKGGEAKHVIILKEMAKRTYDEMLNNPDDERRVQYVGVTRAKENLTIVNGRGCIWI